jgi:hypothetical protein
VVRSECFSAKRHDSGNGKRSPVSKRGIPLRHHGRAGAISNCANTSCCDLTAALISELNYITQTYISSPAYIRWNGNPVVFYFGVESYPI